MQASTSYCSSNNSNLPGRGRGRMTVKALLKVAEGAKVSWSQNKANVLLRIPVADGVRGKEVKLEVLRKRMKLTVQGEAVLEGEYGHPEGIDPDGSFFELEDAPAGSPGRLLLVTLAKQEVATNDMGYEPWVRLLSSDVPDKTITHRAFMDITIDGAPAGRIIFGLYGKVAPKTVDNFRALCTGTTAATPSTSTSSSSSSPAVFSYKGSNFFRIMPGFLVQGGDVVRNDGSSGASIYGPRFEDENFVLQHEGEGVLAMANTGANTNASQFQITCGQFPFLDGKHVVFGQIVHGLSVLRAIEAVPRGPGDRPSVAVAVSDCGELSQEQYEQLLPSLAPEPQPRNLSVPTLTPVTKPSSGAGPGSSAGAGGVAGSAPKGRAAIGGAGPGSAISGSDTLFDLGGKAMLDFDEIMKKIDPSKLDVDGK